MSDYMRDALDQVIINLLCVSFYMFLFLCVGLSPRTAGRS